MLRSSSKGAHLPTNFFTPQFILTLAIREHTGAPQ